MQRGDIWWANFPEPYGSMVGYRRPVLIIQADSFNVSRIQTVIVLILTTNLQVANAPGNVLLPARRTGLPKDSVANVSQILSADRVLLENFVSTLPAREMRKVDAGLRLVLDL